jgi:GNAT superfamily N-acetyltransferase
MPNDTPNDMTNDMRNTAPTLPSSPLAGLRVLSLGAGAEPLLQRFFEANPFYFLAVHGQPAQAGEAHEEIHGRPPPGWPFTSVFVFGWQAADGELAAMANLVSDLLAPGVWHLGTFIVATQRHGSGDAQLLYRSVEDWAGHAGAQWMRLGAVQGHARAEAFWHRQGYQQVATRPGVPMGLRVNTLRVMAKPLQAQGLVDYFHRVERDRPATGPDRQGHDAA